MHRGWRRGTIVGVLLVTLPRRFQGRFLRIKRRFVEIVVTLSWRGSVVDASWMVSWYCHGRVASRLATMVSWTVFHNKTTVRGKLSWHYRGMEVSWMHRGWCHGTVVSVLLVALPRRFRGNRRGNVVAR